MEKMCRLEKSVNKKNEIKKKCRLENWQKKVNAEFMKWVFLTLAELIMKERKLIGKTVFLLFGVF